MPSWKKINIYLQRYWAREVLGKFPVMQHLRFGTIFPMTWTPEVDPSRQQLKFVNGSHRPDERNPNATGTCRSHMAQGNQKEFTEIQVTPCRCFVQTNGRLVKVVTRNVVEMHKHFLLDHSLAVGGVHMGVGIQTRDKRHHPSKSHKHIELRQGVNISIDIANLIGKLLNSRVHTDQFTLKHIDDNYTLNNLSTTVQAIHWVTVGKS